MPEKLTQEEIDALREAVKDGRVQDMVEEDRSAPASEVKVVSYDFRKPQLLSAEHLQVLQLLHQTFSKNLQGLFFTMFKSSGETSLAAMDQVSYGEFVLSLESPTYLLGLSMSQESGPVALELTPPMGQIILDMLLGGDGIAAASEPPREFSALEMNVLRSFSDRILEELALTWKTVQDVVFDVSTQGVEPDQVQIAPPDTPCICMATTLNVNEASGRLHLCYPFSTLQAVFQRADVEQEATAGRRAEARKQALRAMHPVPLSVDIELGRAWITARELDRLAVGDVIKLQQRAGNPLPLHVADRPVGRARVGVRRGRLAAALEDMVSQEQEKARPAAAPAGAVRPKPSPTTGKGSS